MEKAKMASCAKAVLEIKKATYIGIGSGSTIVYLFSLMQKQFTQEELNSKIFIPTSFQSQKLIHDHNLFQGSLNQYPELDIVIDGADEVTKEMTAIKGGGGCHYLEKLVYASSKRKIIVVDESKPSLLLGTKWKTVPVEVDSIALSCVEAKLTLLNYKHLLRMSTTKAGPCITDQGNCIVDIQLLEPIKNIREMYQEIKLITGVIEVGLFWNYDMLLIGKLDGTCEVIEK